jgi:hypothetical protein
MHHVVPGRAQEPAAGDDAPGGAEAAGVHSTTVRSGPGPRSDQIEKNDAMAA